MTSKFCFCFLLLRAQSRWLRCKVTNRCLTSAFNIARKAKSSAHTKLNCPLWRCSVFVMSAEETFICKSSLSALFNVVFSCSLGKLLDNLYSRGNPGKILIFTTTKRKCDQISNYLRRFGQDSVGMHGDKSQQERERALNRFRNSDSCILVATDVAARGLGKCAIRGFLMFTNNI